MTDAGSVSASCRVSTRARSRDSSVDTIQCVRTNAYKGSEGSCCSWTGAMGMSRRGFDLTTPCQSRRRCTAAQRLGKTSSSCGRVRACVCVCVCVLSQHQGSSLCWLYWVQGCGCFLKKGQRTKEVGTIRSCVLQSGAGCLARPLPGLAYPSRFGGEMRERSAPYSHELNHVGASQWNAASPFFFSRKPFPPAYALSDVTCPALARCPRTLPIRRVLLQHLRAHLLVKAPL